MNKDKGFDQVKTLQRALPSHFPWSGRHNSASVAKIGVFGRGRMQYQTN